MRSRLFQAIIPSAKHVVATFVGLLLLSALAVVARAQDKPAEPRPQPQGQQPQGGKELLGPTADTIRPYRPYNRDPFKKALKPKTAKAKQAQLAILLGFPQIETRRAEFRQKVDEARRRDMAEPDPVTQYLVNELDVTGVFRDDQGYGAFIKAQPTGTMLFVRNGTRCYNGEVLRIESDNPETGGTKVVFREFYYMEQNGKKTQQERMQVKTPGTPSK